MLRRILLSSALAALFLVAVAPDANAQLQNPVPTITGQLVPPSAPPGIYEAAVHVTGTGFLNVSVVNWNGTPLQTYFLNSTQILGVIPQADLVSAGTGLISVSNPAPAGGTSNSVIFTVAVSPSAPVLSSVLLPGGASASVPVVADFNGDGKLDLAMSVDIINGAGILVQSGAVSVLLGNGDGSFKNANTYALAESLWQPVAGDFNGDGKLDLVLTSSRTTTAYLLLGNGDGTFQAPRLINLDPLNLGLLTVGPPIAGDFNGDGKLDLMFAGMGGLEICFGNGDGTFQNPVELNIQGGLVADFNGDGILDIAGWGQGQLSIYLGNGDGTFQPAKTTAIAATNLVAADLNGDGKMDLL